MKEFLVAITEPTIVAIDIVAFLVVVYATLDTAIRVAARLFKGFSAEERRELWLHYARWLVAALTFQLAADIVETSISTDWESIARLGAVAVIRTFLNYFLERDVGEQRELEERGAEKPG